jgi:hypothetical protein
MSFFFTRGSVCESRAASLSRSTSMGEETKDLGKVREFSESDLRRVSARSWRWVEPYLVDGRLGREEQGSVWK